MTVLSLLGFRRISVVFSELMMLVIDDAEDTAPFVLIPPAMSDSGF
jgi:hypothetical protein